VKRSELSELHYITAISNVPSIMKYGILCYRNAKKIGHVTVAMPEVQDRRAKKRVPGAQPLHSYANLYLCARNPMLFKLRNLHKDLCVLRVDTDVLDLPGVVITDGNAASNYTRFWPSPVGLSKVDKNLVFAKFWTDQNQIVEWQKKRAKCAEVLVPNLVESSFVLGAYVSCGESLLRFGAIESRLSVTVDSYLFFR
jgi:hypothetical protein